MKKLFGLYTYALPSNGQLSNAAIFYGDNGVGKSTVLRLAFHLLSAAGDRGHRTALYASQFKELHIDLASGITLSAVRNKESPSVLKLSISKLGKDLAVWNYDQNSRRQTKLIEGSRVRYILEEREGGLVPQRVQKSTALSLGNVVTGEDVYMQVLAQQVPTVFILNAERRLDSDSVADPSDEVELRQVMHYSEPKRIHDLVVRSREIALSQALNAAAKWIGNKAIHGANKGTMNVHSVYGNVLRHLVGTPVMATTSNDSTDIASLLKRLGVIESKTAELAKHELATELSMNEFRKALATRAISKRLLAANLVRPYFESLEGRLDAVNPIYQLINKFLKIVNSMLSDKQLLFSLSTGFSIKNRLGSDLQSSQLSSGEQQLLLLFCYVLTARDNPSVFMIDEPEISLNVKWQRLLVQSLLDITEDSSIQFVFASHSMELLAQHKNRVVKLVNTDVG